MKQWESEDTMSNNRDIATILHLMEDSTSMGGIATPLAMMVDPEITTFKPNGGYEEPDNTGKFSAIEIRLAKRFVELVGGYDRAKTVISKVQECEECLGIDDESDQQEPQSEEDQIGQMAGMMPYSSDLPTGKNRNFSSLYNPSAMARPLS